MPDVNCRDEHENDSIKTEVRWTLSQQKIRFWFFDFQNWIWPLFWDFFISSSFNRTLFQISKWKLFWESRLSQVTQSLFLHVSIRNDSGLQERAADSWVGLYCPIRKFGEWEEIKNTRFLMNKGERLTSYLRLGALLVRDKKYDRAEALYKSCIVEFEDDFRCYFNYAQLRCVQKRYWEAEQLFLEAETRWHGALNAPYLPDLTCSISHGKSLNSHPRNQGEVTISNALSGLLLILGQPSKALKYCEKVRKEHFYLNSLY
jgi:tetratricopeptide (TPR) repeat protein